MSDNFDEIGRTVRPTPAQAARYAQLRDDGTPPHEAGRIVREEARQEAARIDTSGHTSRA